MVDILVLGATGFTGRLVVRYLYTHSQRASFTFAIGARSQSKGEALKKSLGVDDSVKLVLLNLANYDEIEAAVKEAKVVLNLVGPYWTWGTDVVRACAVHGKRYVDLAGEPHFIRKICDRYDYLATQTGAIIVPTCGFDSIPADILVFLSNKTLKDALGPTTQLGLSQTFYAVKGGVSGGTLNSLITNIEVVPRVRLLEGERDYALSQVRGHPSPPLQLATPIPFSSPTQYGAFWPMAITNRAIVQRTFGLNELLSTKSHILLGVEGSYDKEVQIRPLTYGPQFRYTEYFVVGRSKLLATAVSVLLKLWFAVLFSCTPVRWLFKKLAPKPGEGPSEQAMENGWMEVTNYTECATSPGTYAKSVMRGQGDPGYLLTAAMIAESALGLALDDAQLPPSANIGGILTPATALGGVLVTRLEATGRMHFESEIVRAGEESRKSR